MTDRSPQARLFRAIERLVPDIATLRAETHRRSVPGGPWQPLMFEVLARRDMPEPTMLVVSFAHYYEQNGDLVPDPDMEIRVWPQIGVARPATFQNALVYQRVYDESGERYRVGLSRDLTSFALEWCKNAGQQGHKLGPETNVEGGTAQTKPL